MNAVVIGVGGCGKNILEVVHAAGDITAKLVYVNTDRNSIEKSGIPDKILLDKLDPNYVINKVDLDPYDKVILVAGLGGSTGTAVIPILANVADRTGKRVYAVLTRPLPFEGTSRRTIAKDTIRKLEFPCHHTVIFHNEVLFSRMDPESHIDDMEIRIPMEANCTTGDIFNKINKYAALTIKMFAERNMPDNIYSVVLRLERLLGKEVIVGSYGQAIDVA